MFLTMYFSSAPDVKIKITQEGLIVSGCATSVDAVVKELNSKFIKKVCMVTLEPSYHGKISMF